MSTKNSSTFKLYTTIKVVQYQAMILCAECVKPQIGSIVYNKTHGHTHHFWVNLLHRSKRKILLLAIIGTMMDFI